MRVKNVKVSVHVLSIEVNEERGPGFNLNFLGGKSEIVSILIIFQLLL